MSPDGFPPFVSPFDGDCDPVQELESAAKALFAQQVCCLVKEVDALIDGSPQLQADFDAIMDFVARDALNDHCPIGVADSTFIHLSDLGLVNAAPVKVVPGVGIITHRPFHRDRAIAAKGR